MAFFFQRVLQQRREHLEMVPHRRGRRLKGRAQGTPDQVVLGLEKDKEKYFAEGFELGLLNHAFFQIALIT
jgi:hypothetical protein